MFRVNSVIFHVTLGTQLKMSAAIYEKNPPQQGTKIHELLQFHEKKNPPRVWPLLLCVSSKVIKCFSLFAALNLLQQVYERKFLFLLYCISQSSNQISLRKRSILSPDIKFQFFIQPRKRPKSVKIWPFTMTFVEKSTLNQSKGQQVHNFVTHLINALTVESRTLRIGRAIGVTLIL